MHVQRSKRLQRLQEVRDRGSRQNQRNQTSSITFPLRISAPKARFPSICTFNVSRFIQGQLRNDELVFSNSTPNAQYLFKMFKSLFFPPRVRTRTGLGALDHEPGKAMHARHSASRRVQGRGMDCEIPGLLASALPHMYESAVLLCFHKCVGRKGTFDPAISTHKHARVSLSLCLSLSLSLSLSHTHTQVERTHIWKLSKLLLKGLLHWVTRDRFLD